MNLMEMRHRLDWTQKQFADYLGMSVRTLQNWEQGVRQPPDYIVRLIYRLLLAEGVLKE